MALGIPPNFTFKPSSQIAPSYHTGPQLFHAAGMVLHPLQASGHIGAPGTPGSTAPSLAGSTFTASQIAQMLISSPHPYTLNGREPG